VSVLSQPDVSHQFAKNYVSVHVDSGDLPGNDRLRDVIERHNRSELHPVLVFLDGAGKEIARIKGGLKSKEDALLLDRFVSEKHYRKTDFPGFRAAQRS
jgi:hypothetical protein